MLHVLKVYPTTQEWLYKTSLLLGLGILGGDFKTNTRFAQTYTSFTWKNKQPRWAKLVMGETRYIPSLCLLIWSDF